VAVVVVALVVEPRRGDHVDAGLAADRRELLDVAPGVARHRVDHCAQPERLRRLQLGDGDLDRIEPEVRMKLHRAPAVDDEVLVRIGDAQVGRVDVAEHGPHE
jgi:hypothetical protein